MAQFRAIIQGSKGEVSRLGGKSAGIRSQTDGWNCGVRVIGYHEDGKDYFRVTLTSGSGYTGNDKEIGIFTKDDLI